MITYNELISLPDCWLGCLVSFEGHQNLVDERPCVMAFVALVAFIVSLALVAFAGFVGHLIFNCYVFYLYCYSDYNIWMHLLTVSHLPTVSYLLLA